jgi:polyhydroxyalkanoate synthase
VEVGSQPASPEGANRESRAYWDALDQLGLVGALGTVATRTALTAMPRRSWQLGSELARIALGRSDVRPAPRDWRFTNRAWAEHPVLSRLGRAYLAWVDTLFGLVDDAELDWRADERARCAVRNLTSALAPTNLFVLNPDACERAFETGGMSVVRGLRNAARDVLHNRGVPRSVPPGVFEVGRNLAVTEGAVVFRNEVLELLQYRPTTATVRRVPVVVVPPQINKYYVMDLAPGRSFVEHAVRRGFEVYAVSWRNPSTAHRDWTLDTYVASVEDAMDAASEISGSEKVAMVGVCAGGLTTAGALGHLAAAGRDLVGSATFAVTQLDYSVPSMIGMFGSPDIVRNSLRASAASGTLEGRVLAGIFSALRPDDLIWNYWVGNNLLGDEPSAFDVMAWNADSTALPAALHAQFLDVFLHNSLASGDLSVLGTPVDLAKVTCDTMVVAGRTDHLVPWKACYANCALFGGATEFVLSSSGHIQCLVNPPGTAKMHITTGPDPDLEPDSWLARATQSPGVWWDRWAEWQAPRAGGERAAPATLGSRAHPPLAPAPGDYVRNR